MTKAEQWAMRNGIERSALERAGMTREQIRARYARQAVSLRVAGLEHTQEYKALLKAIG
jgi:hypothetical protein